jgi:predicted hydrocarbon binding protein
MKSNIKIPKTGKIGNLARNIEKETNQDIVLKVMQNVEQFESTFDRVKKAEWIKGTIKRLEQDVGEEKSSKIMENCGRGCCRKHARYKKLISEFKSFEEFLDKLSTGGFQFRLKDKNTIVGEYDKCYCYQVKQTKKPFPTKTYCQCGVGHIREIFESAFKRPVEVELMQSVITGSESCKFLIHI